MRTSTNYVATLDPNSTFDMEKLQIIRNTIKTLNKFNTNKFKVSIKGRLGKNNPNAFKYKNKRVVTIKQEDAARYDVYIYEKY